MERLRRREPPGPEIGAAVVRPEALQARRFAGTYADLLASQRYGAAARFFLEELYSDRDFGERDAQFARIAGAVERLFPRDVADTAAGLAQLHALTESLDHAMARIHPLDGHDDIRGLCEGLEARSTAAVIGNELESVVAIGAEMTRLTRLPGLRMMLKMMRGPASAAGLASLQRFWSPAFVTFATAAKPARGAPRVSPWTRSSVNSTWWTYVRSRCHVGQTALQRISA